MNAAAAAIDAAIEVASSDLAVARARRVRAENELHDAQGAEAEAERAFAELQDGAAKLRPLIDPEPTEEDSPIFDELSEGGHQ